MDFVPFILMAFFCLRCPKPLSPLQGIPRSVLPTESEPASLLRGRLFLRRRRGSSFPSDNTEIPSAIHHVRLDGLLRPSGVVDVVPRHVEEQRLDWHGLDLGRVGDQVAQVDVDAGSGVVVETLYEGGRRGHVLGCGDGGVVVEFVQVGDGAVAVHLGLSVREEALGESWVDL